MIKRFAQMTMIPWWGAHLNSRYALRWAAECLAGCSAIIILTVSGHALQVNFNTAGFLYLLTVVFVALLCGFWQATLISLLAVVCLDFFFLPPVYTLNVTDTHDWVALVSFEICALVVGHLSTKEQKSAREADLQRNSMKKLYELSRDIHFLDLQLPPGPQLVKMIHRNFETSDVAIFSANGESLDYVGPWAQHELQIAKSTYLHETDRDDFKNETVQRALRVGGDPVGAIVIRGDINPLTADALASLAAITFERHLSFEKARLAEAVRQSEQLRAAVLDALAHAFKTPLTVIRTATSGLLDTGSLSESQTELATLIDEESIHLSHLCTDLLQTAKLKAEEIGLEQNEVILSQLINQVLMELSETLLGHEIDVSIAPQATCIQADRNLLATILTQYLDNAAKYSDPEAPISIAVQESSAAWLLSVRSRGDIIPLQDRERIFERFYRCTEGRQRAAGAGVGLSIVKKMAEAHQGHVWVISNEEEGTTFFLSVPKLK